MNYRNIISYWLAFLCSFVFVTPWALCDIASKKDADNMLLKIRNEPDTACYLVVLYDAKKDKTFTKPTMKFMATVVGVIKGSKKIGEKIKFDRVSESGFKGTDHYLGALYLLVYHKAPMNGSPIQGEYYVRSQHPGGFIKCSALMLQAIKEYSGSGRDDANS